MEEEIGRNGWRRKMGRRKKKAEEGKKEGGEWVGEGERSRK